MLVLGASLIGATVTQVPVANPANSSWLDALGISRVFTSSWFLGIAFCFLLALGYSLVGQFRRARTAFYGPPQARLCSSGDLLMKIAGAIREEEVSTATLFPPMLSNHLRSQGFHSVGPVEDKKGIFIFRKNRWGVWGPFVFHAGLLFLVSAALFTYGLEKRGFVQLIEGDTFLGRSGDFLNLENGPWTASFEPGFRLHLQKFRHAYWDTGDLKDLINEIVISDSAGERQVMLDKGTPLTVGAVRIYQSGHYGYTVKLSLMEGEKETVPSYFSLDMTDPKKFLVGKSDFPATSYICNFKFYPDLRGKSPYPFNPVLHVKFSRDNREIQSATLLPGEETRVEGHRFRFVDVRGWTGLILTENKALPLVYLGFFLSISGIFMLYMLIPQTILLSLTPSADGSLSLAADVTCRRGKKLLLEELREALNRMVSWKI